MEESPQLILPDENLQKDLAPTKPVENKPQALAEVKASEVAYLQAGTLEARYRIAKAFFNGGMVPKGFKSAEQVFAGLEFAMELGLKPLSGLRNIAVVNGSPSLWGDLPLALCQRTKQLKFISEKIFDKDYVEICPANKNLNATPWLAVVDIDREGYERVTRWFSTDDAKQAGLLGKDTPWKTYPQIMLRRRARSMALKDIFADALQGASILEHDFNMLPSGDGPGMIKDVTHTGSRKVDPAAALNQAVIQET